MNQKIIVTICLILSLGLIYAFNPAGPAFAAEGYDQVASSADMSTASQVGKYGMTPVYGRDVADGSYDITVDSSSSFFKARKCKLNVSKGKMSARMTMYTTSYEYIYLGTAEDAAKAPISEYIAPEDRDGESTYEFPVEALDTAIECAAFSKKEKKWYPRQILFDATTLPVKALKITLPDYDKIEKALASQDSGDEQTQPQSAAQERPVSTDPVDIDRKDGEYSIQVQMTGGSGRASVTSPTWLIVKDGKAYARLMWSSTYYDYMLLGDKKFTNETTDGGNSTFTIPITVDNGMLPLPIPNW